MQTPSHVPFRQPNYTFGAGIVTDRCRGVRFWHFGLASGLNALRTARPCPMIDIRRVKPSGHSPDRELVNDNGDIDGQLPPAPRRREPVARTSLVNDPRLHEILEELDVALDVGTSDSYLSQSPLSARLVLPRSRGRWSQVRLTESAPSFTVDSISEANLADLDRELPDSSDEPDSFSAAPLLRARLPGPTPLRVGNTVSEWLVSVTLIILIFAGVAASALVFHERLSDIVYQWETQLR